jgi:hypothetical protein
VARLVHLEHSRSRAPDQQSCADKSPGALK